MTVRLLEPDSAQPTVSAMQYQDPGAFVQLLSRFGAVLQEATRSENAFAAGTGSLREAVYGRARADIAIAVAVAAAQRTTQALQTVLNMQL